MQLKALFYERCDILSLDLFYTLPTVGIFLIYSELIFAFF